MGLKTLYVRGNLGNERLLPTMGGAICCCYEKMNEKVGFWEVSVSLVCSSYNLRTLLWQAFERVNTKHVQAVTYGHVSCLGRTT